MVTLQPGIVYRNAIVTDPLAAFVALESGLSVDAPKLLI